MEEYTSDAGINCAQIIFYQPWCDGVQVSEVMVVAMDEVVIVKDMIGR